ncbi:uncharacterized protein J4E84_004423 [Alternaria hordeiaustralica]|uniref:uncharacterized protein n=1 Tax=Alternaria hordeiaustralica TaxID=1187925 RepID=UPI0020C44594|nr:uncharacterized protein J4E84_004423 [Alternaria hordeiaustralica]KAI4690239.1 hypothetical protein J4E84_004423 [Alternaria hordeiaustralica]
MAQSVTPARRTLYNDPTFSDIKIRQIYKGKVKEYWAHKAVLCAHSGWFMAALTGQFKEASADTIEVHEDDPEIFQTMMEFFYNMDLKKSHPCYDIDKFVKTDVVPIISLHALADKYDAKILQETAISAFKTQTGRIRIHPAIETVHMLVHAYYSACSVVRSGMGEAIVQYIFKVNLYGLRNGEYGELCVQYSNLGADFYLVGIAGGELKYA